MGPRGEKTAEQKCTSSSSLSLSRALLNVRFAGAQKEREGREREKVKGAPRWKEYKGAVELSGSPASSLLARSLSGRHENSLLNLVYNALSSMRVPPFSSSSYKPCPYGSSSSSLPIYLRAPGYMRERLYQSSRLPPSLRCSFSNIVL